MNNSSNHVNERYYILVSKKALLILAIALFFSGCKENESMGKAEPDTPASSRISPVSTSPEEFTIVVIPDAQYYVSNRHGGLQAMFKAQTDWIIANRASQNIVYVASLGDISENGDQYQSHWDNAKDCYYSLENPVTTGLPEGIPYGTCVGNHDQSPDTGHPLTCTTVKYNATFGRDHFANKTYYGENLDTGTDNNDNHYDLITAGGIDFIIIYIEFNSAAGTGDVTALAERNRTNQWAWDLCTTFSSRKAIIVSHYIIKDGKPAAWSGDGQGQALYNKLKDRHNVFLMLCGHYGSDLGEGEREDNFNGNTIKTFMSDYQGPTTVRQFGGNGLMRIMRFRPDRDEITVKTYSPYRNLYETDANSQFTRRLFGPVNGKYKIMARNSSTRAIATNGLSTAEDVNIFLYTYGTNTNDQWNITSLGAGYFKVINQLTGKAMVATLNAGPVINNTDVVQRTYTADANLNDEWQIMDVGSGYYKMVNRANPAVVLDVDGTANGSDARVKTFTGATNQHFKLIRL